MAKFHYIGLFFHGGVWYTRLSPVNLANVFVKSFFIDFPIFFWKKGALN